MIYSFYERRVINMALLRIHKQAFQLEQILTQLMQKTHPQGYEMEITEIYDSPIRMCEEVLDEVKTNDNFETIEEIKQKYWPYQHCILTQLSEDIAQALCDDMEYMKRCS